MKIAIDISQIVHQGTGVARYMSELVDNILTFDKVNNYLLFGYSFRKQQLIKDFVASHRKKIESKIFPLPPTLWEFIFNDFHKLKIENLIGNFDIIHTSDWIEVPSDKLKISTIHDLLPVMHPQYFPKKIVSTQLKRLNWINKESDIIIVDSVSTKTDCLKHLSIKEKNIYVVYPGIDKKFFIKSSESSKILEKYRINSPYIISVATQEPRKNLKGAIQAFQKLNNQRLDLIIVGKFGWGDKVEHNKNIKLLGYVSEEDLPILYQNSACLIYPSLYEGFGFPILEAFASGVNVVTSDRGSIREIGSDFAFYVDPLNINKIAEGIDKAMHASFNNKAKEWAKTFSWERAAKEIIKIYEKLFKNDYKTAS